MQYSLLLMGVILMAMGSINLYRYLQQRKSWLRFDAIVVDNHIGYAASLDGSRTVYYSPIISFWRDGEEQRMIYNEEHANSPLYEQGEKIVVYMNPRDSNRIIIEEVASNIWVPCILIVIGAGFAIFSFFAV